MTLVPTRLQPYRSGIHKPCRIATQQRQVLYLPCNGSLDLNMPIAPEVHCGKHEDEAARKVWFSALLDQGLPLIHIERELSLSKSSIDRLCSETPEQLQRWKTANHEWKLAKHRQAFLNALGSCTELTRKDAQKLEGAGYSWLYRHDRTWLSAYVTSSLVVSQRKPTNRRERVNWSARDEECIKAIASLGRRIELESWERKKTQAILRRLPKLSFSPRLDRLPKSKAAITELLAALNRSPQCQPLEKLL